MPSGHLTENFLQAVIAAETEAAAVAGSALNVQLREWALGNLDAWTGRVLIPQDIGSAFDRNEAGAVYGNALLRPNQGSAGDAMSAKVQSDYLAAMERAFRARHATPIRSELFAAARRSGHAMAAGPLGRVATYAQDLLVSGNTGFKG